MRAFVSSISLDNETCVIILENQTSFILPLMLLPENISQDDFLIINHGSIIIDPDNEKNKLLIKQTLMDSMES